MRINKVSLEGDVDEFGGRALAVSTTSDIGTFRTPNRALTSTEFQYKAKLPFPPALNNDISEIVHQLYGSKWTKFMSTNGSFYNGKKNLDSFAAKMAYTIKRYYPQIASETHISDEAIHQIIMLQRAGELDFISMPSLPSSNQTFERTAGSFIEEVLSENEEPLVYLDMGLDPQIFQERFSTLLEFVNTGQIHSIGLIYRSWQRNIRNYEYLWKNRSSEVFLQMSEIPRRTSGTPKLTSTMHLLQKFGIDSFSVRLVTNPGSKKGREEKDKLKSFQIKNRFDPSPLVFRPFREWENRTPLGCDCPICNGKNATEFIDTYYGEHESYSGATLNAANNLHEYYRSADEFALSRGYIVDGELKEYFKNKDGLKSSDIPISKTIFDF